jgi:hypothetical protein
MSSMRQLGTYLPLKAGCKETLGRLGLEHSICLFCLAMLLVSSLMSSASAQGLACQGVQKPQQVADLLFGRKIGNAAVVSEGAWRRFVAREITPRFPDGLTILDGRGQWLDPGSKRIVREPSTVVMIAMPGHAEDFDRLNEIAEAYKKQFRQQSVGIIIRQACVSF